MKPVYTISKHSFLDGLCQHNASPLDIVIKQDFVQLADYIMQRLAVIRHLDLQCSLQLICDSWYDFALEMR